MMYDWRKLKKTSTGFHHTLDNQTKILRKGQYVAFVDREPFDYRGWDRFVGFQQWKSENEIKVRKRTNTDFLHIMNLQNERSKKTIRITYLVQPNTELQMPMDLRMIQLKTRNQCAESAAARIDRFLVNY